MVGVNQVAILRLEDVATRTVRAGRGGGAGAVTPGVALQGEAFTQYCARAMGPIGGRHSRRRRPLVGVTDRRGEESLA